MSKRAIDRRKAINVAHKKQRDERERAVYGTVGDRVPKGQLMQEERVNRQIAAKSDNKAYYQSGTEWHRPR